MSHNHCSPQKIMATTELPGTMKALVTLGKGSVAIQDKPVPSIDDDEILVKVLAVAQNPTDYKCTLPSFLWGISR